jgi:trafficking protein particle complex subunit 10
LNSQSGDYSAAATYFGRLVPLYAQDRWSTIEDSLLSVYARCLKELHRKDEYVRIELALLAKYAANQQWMFRPAAFSGPMTIILM